MGIRTAAVMLVGIALCLAFASEAAAAEAPPDIRTMEEITGELTSSQAMANVISFPFRMVGYAIYYPLKFLFYDIWAWLFEALFGGDGPSIGTLIDRLKDPDSAVRMASLRALGFKRSPDALGPIIDRFFDSDDGVRAEAVTAVARIGSDAASSRLLDLVANGKTWQVRASAIQALGLLRDRTAVWAILKTLSESNWYIRYHGANALGSIGHVAAGPPLAKLLADPQFRVRAAAARALGRIGDPKALPHLHQALKKLKQEGSVVRASLVYALGALGGPVEAETIFALLKNPALAHDPFTRGAIAHVLGEMGFQKAGETLTKMLLTQEKEAVMFGAAAGLARLGRTEPLFKALLSPNPYCRIAGIMGVQRAGGPEAVEHLLPLVSDPYSDVRRAVLVALLRLGYRPTIPLVIRQLTAPDPQMRLWALTTLKRLSGLDHGLDLAKWKEWWKEKGRDIDFQKLFAEQPPARRRLSRRQRADSRKVWARHARSSMG
jgi:HEAT repeat protein